MFSQIPQCYPAALLDMAKIDKYETTQKTKCTVLRQKLGHTGQYGERVNCYIHYNKEPDRTTKLLAGRW